MSSLVSAKLEEHRNNFSTAGRQEQAAMTNDTLLYLILLYCIFFSFIFEI